MAIALDTLAYARRLREAGFSEEQAEGQAEALAAAMTDTLATKQDLHEVEARIGARFAQVDARFAQIDARFDSFEKHVDARFTEQESRHVIRLEELEKRIDLRFKEQTSQIRGEMADLERRLTTRMGGIMVAGITLVSALVKLL